MSAISDPQSWNRWKSQNTELLLRLGDVLCRLSGEYTMLTLNCPETGREKLMEQLKAIESEMSQVKGIASFRHAWFFVSSRRPEINQLTIRILSYMVFVTLFRETPNINLMTLAQIVVPDSPEPLLSSLESRRIIAELIVTGGLRLQPTHFDHLWTPHVRLHQQIISEILGKRSIPIVNKETVEAVRQERQSKIMDTIERNRKLKAMSTGIPKPINLPTDRLKWMRRSDGDVL